MSGCPDASELRYVHAEIGRIIGRLDVALATEDLIYARIVDINNFQTALRRIRKPLGRHLAQLDACAAKAREPAPERPAIILPPGK